MAGKPVVTVGHRAIGLVRRGKHVVWERGSVSRGARNVVVEGRPVARLGDRVPMRSTSGTIRGGVSSTVVADGRRVARVYCRVAGPRIIRAWVTQGSRKTFAG